MMRSAQGPDDSGHDHDGDHDYYSHDDNHHNYHHDTIKTKAGGNFERGYKQLGKLSTSRDGGGAWVP